MIKLIPNKDILLKDFLYSRLGTIPKRDIDAHIVTYLYYCVITANIIKHLHYLKTLCLMFNNIII